MVSLAPFSTAAAHFFVLFADICGVHRRDFVFEEREERRSRDAQGDGVRYGL